MLKTVRGWLLILLSSLGSLAIAECPKGDLTGGCEVDFRNVQAISAQWLSPPGSRGDLDGLHGVQGRDLAVLAEGWPQVGIPLVIRIDRASAIRKY